VTRRTAASALLTAVLAAALALLLPASPAAAARTVDVVLSAERPATVSLAPGDSVRFVSGEEGPLGPPHQVTSTRQDGTRGWEYESPVLGPGDSTDPVAFDRAGTYLFVDRRGGPGPLGSEVVGRIVVSAPRAASPSPTPVRTAAPTPPASTGAPAPPPPGPTPVTTSSPADLSGLLGGVAAAPLDGALPDDPVVPPALVDLGLEPDDDDTADADDRPLVQAAPGPLPGTGTSRGFGLPASLAALAAVGVASLLVRVLLAEPSARTARPLLRVTAG
jgi:plastocyanin